jgi:TrbC/VIRB2 family pilin
MTTRMKLKPKFTPQTLNPPRTFGLAAAMLALNSLPVFAQGAGFNSTDLKTGISNTLAVIMMFGFVLGIAAVIAGGFAIRRGDVDQGKMSIIGGAIIAAAPAVIFAFYKIFGLDGSSAVGVGNF